MKAVGYTQYGPPDVLQIMEINQPMPNDDQVLVKVLALSVNPAEAHQRNGIPLARSGTGLLRPKGSVILAADFAGRIEAVGKNIHEYRVGDEVFGRRGSSGFAEYVAVSEKPIMFKPANITFEQAAAIPVAGLTALQSLRDRGKLQPGQSVLINGASGGLGTFSVQIAKALGAQVTGVTSAKNLELVRSLGADRVIDYSREDFTRSGQCYDLVLDNVGNRSIFDYARALKPNGICVITGYHSIGKLFQFLALGRIASKIWKKQMGMMISHIEKNDLQQLKDLVEAGKLVPAVDKVYPFSEVREAYRYLETHHARGKIVLTV